MIIFACVTISLSCRCLCCVFKCVAHVFYFSDFFISCCVLCMSLYAYQVNVLLCVFFCASFLVFIECSVIPLLFSCYPLGTFQFTFLSRSIFLFSCVSFAHVPSTFILTAFIVPFSLFLLSVHMPICFFPSSPRSVLRYLHQLFTITLGCPTFKWKWYYNWMSVFF